MNEESNKNNVVLLTVIAIVTMLVVVVGATFAYLASRIDGKGQSNINVTTNVSSDLFLIDAGSEIDILATEDNFGQEQAQNKEDLSSETKGSITYQTSSESEVTRKYKISLNVSENNMEYTSGVCYSKTTPNELSETECGEGNIWATTNGKDYACYPKGTPNSNTDLYSCTASNTYIWTTEKVAELVLDFYKADENVTKDNCNTGKCYDSSRNIVSSATSKSACNDLDGSSWVTDYYDDSTSRCYVLQGSYDITTEANDSTKVLLDEKSITTSKAIGKINEYYMARVTLRNLMHNQIQNGQKKFVANIEYTQVVNEEP